MAFEYYVTKGGVPCVLSHEIQMHWLGLLKPCALHEEPHVFGVNYGPGKLKAERAIERTNLARSELAEALKHGTLYPEWTDSKMGWLVAPGEFEIQKRKVAAVVETETLAK